MNWFTALLILILLLIFFLFLCYYLWAKKKHTYWSQRGIFSPPTHWLYGHVLNCETGTYSITQHFTDICNSPLYQHVPAIGFYIFHQPCLLLRDPNLIRRLPWKDLNFFANHRFYIQSQNNVVDNARMVLEMNVGRERLQALFPLMLEGAEHLRCYLNKKVPSSKEIEVHVHSASRRFITDVMVSVVFGVSTNSFEEPDTEIYKHACGLYRKFQPSFLLVLISTLFPHLRSLFGTCSTRIDFFRDLFWKSMNKKKEIIWSRSDFINMLLELYSASGNHFKFKEDELFGQVMLLIINGLETSALTMTLTLFEMVRNPTIRKRLRQEIREKIGIKPITFELIWKMRFLKSVVLETLRKYTSTPFVSQVTKQNYKIPNSNIVIEKGTVVCVSSRDLYLDLLSCPTLLNYDPDRFNGQNCCRISKHTCLPFGDGLTKCLGNRIVLLQIMIGLIVVMRDYKISMNLKKQNRAESIISAILNEDFVMILEKSPVIND